MKKILLWTLSIFFLASAIVLTFFSEIIFGPSIQVMSPFVSSSEFSFYVTRIIAAVIFGILGIIFLVLTLVQPKTNASTTGLHQEINPLVSLITGLIVILFIYFEVGSNYYYGAGWLIYILGGLLFLFGLAGFMRKILTRSNTQSSNQF